MGCNNSKETEVQSVPQIGARRRLSVLKNPNDVAGGAGGALGGGGNKASSPGLSSNASGGPQVSCMLNKVDVLLDLLPKGDRRYSLIGQQTLDQQKSFEEKCEAVSCTECGEKASLNIEHFGVGYACKKGLKPDAPNQDDFFVLQVDHDLGIYGVFDGHGPFGHEISSFTHQLLPGVMLKSDTFGKQSLECLRRAFEKTQLQIEKAQEKRIFDANLSGTTGTVCYLEENKEVLHVGHVGDSRAVIAKLSANGKIKAEDLTKDHKPGDAAEKARINKMGGQVRCLAGDINERVFVKKQLYPGLAMSRSIGDLVARTAGVIAEPDMKTVKLDPKEKPQFFLVCSDGVWEFITSQEACEIVAKFDSSDPHKAAEALAQEAWKRWIAEEGSTVDDITVIVVNLQAKRNGSDRFVQAAKKRDMALMEKKEALKLKAPVLSSGTGSLETVVEGAKENGSSSTSASSMSSTPEAVMPLISK